MGGAEIIGTNEISWSFWVGYKHGFSSDDPQINPSKFELNHNSMTQDKA